MAVEILELGGSLGYLDEVYEQLQKQPASVDPSWREAHGTPKPNGSNGHGGNGVAARSLARQAPALPTFSRPGQVTLSPFAVTPSV
jgi:2-oxoglutarate dehydrogenase complex dehydrogenase (E1) component-like enzyme